ncbi:heme-binding protein [Psychrobacter sp. 16-MNA-CIBAN-0192]|uniref:SOUL family heme-binding protein n=1 Tax=Psychrobacter sp. 16-MNA-CIBAN-0192 TaxID=3140448 RepID=UPI00332E1FAF
MATEEPHYTILMQSEDFELRRYDAQLVAQTWVSGDQDAASRQGFKVLADYIFGNNKTDKGDSSKISMTAPVTMQPQATADNDTRKSESAKIAMTAPVMMKKEDNKWRVQFVMPSQYTMQTLPKPNNPDISIVEIPVKTYAVIKFSGLAGSNKVEFKTKELQTWMQSQKLVGTAVPELARYNPPWILPFMRRNEIMIAY